MSALELGPMANQVTGPARKVMLEVRQLTRRFPTLNIISVSKDNYGELLAGVNRLLAAKRLDPSAATELAHGKITIRARP